MLKNMKWQHVCSLLALVVLSLVIISTPVFAKESEGAKIPILTVEAKNSTTVTVNVQSNSDYILEWDTNKNFIHKRAYALFQGNNYQSYNYSSANKQVVIRFPVAGVYYVRVHSYNDQGQSVMSKSLKIVCDGYGNSKRSSSGKIINSKTKLNVTKKQDIIKVTFNLPKNAEGYFVEFCSNRNFKEKVLYSLYLDSGKYTAVWKNSANGKQTISLPISEFSGKYVYIRAYYIDGKNVSKASAIKKIKVR